MNRKVLTEVGMGLGGLWSRSCSPSACSRSPGRRSRSLQACPCLPRHPLQAPAVGTTPVVHRTPTGPRARRRANLTTATQTAPRSRITRAGRGARTTETRRVRGPTTGERLQLLRVGVGRERARRRLTRILIHPFAPRFPSRNRGLSTVKTGIRTETRIRCAMCCEWVGSSPHSL